MRILITAASSSSEMSGVQRHAFNVARCLLLHPEISAVHLAVAPWQQKLVQAAGPHPDERLSVHIADMNRNAIDRNDWYYRRLPSLATRLQADVIHLSYPVPINASALPCPAVVTLHDLYPYEIPLNFGFPHVIFNRWILQQCLGSVDAIACVSDITALRLKQYVPSANWHKAVRIYNCVEPEPLCAIRAPIPDWKGEPFLLCVAQHRRNKNIPLLIRVFNRLLRQQQIDPSMRLVVVGITGPETRRIRRLVSQYGLGRSVVFREGLTEPELQWCYARCEALAAPSSIEGFGLPVAEALLAGCRVICSDIPALREVGGDNCHFVPLGKHEEDRLSEAIVLSLLEPARKPVSLPLLSAPVLAKQYVALYRNLHVSAAAAHDGSFLVPANAATPERHSS
jgi:glycosyltransferase involved in cell wall biosynthesis